MIHDRLDFRCQIMECESFEHCMCRQNRSRNDGSFDAHGRDDGQCNSQRALAYAGNILHCRDTFHKDILLRDDYRDIFDAIDMVSLIK